MFSTFQYFFIFIKLTVLIIINYFIISELNCSEQFVYNCLNTFVFIFFSVYYAIEKF